MNPYAKTGNGCCLGLDLKHGVIKFPNGWVSAADYFRYPFFRKHVDEELYQGLTAINRYQRRWGKLP